MTIRLEGVRKAFGRNQVLQGVNLEIPAGQVTVLMGSNGAGKSTIVKILCGVHQADAGKVALGGQPFAPASPSEALRAGVVTVHQDIGDGVVPDLDVASNLLLDYLADGAGFFLNKRAMRTSARKIAHAVGLSIDVSRLVASLSPADRQLVAIARAMTRKPQLLILDEPTSSLSAAETERLFLMIERLRDSGGATLYISHRMADIKRLADRIVSIRDGAISGLFEDQPLDYAGAIRAMLGHEITKAGVSDQPAGKPVLEVRGLKLREYAKAFSLTCHENEVVVVAGLVGSGKSDFAAALFGLATPVAGEIYLDGHPYRPGSATAAIDHGVFFCPKDRMHNAVIADFCVSENLTLPFLKRHSRMHFLRPKSEASTSQRMVSAMGIVCQGGTDEIMTLSGGNQQKVVVARWLAEPSRLLIMDEPFQGVDIQARYDIGDRIRASASTRATIVFVTELDEALMIADRILVMAGHSVISSHRNRDVDIDAIMSEVMYSAQSERTGATK